MGKSRDKNAGMFFLAIYLFSFWEVRGVKEMRGHTFTLLLCSLLDSVSEELPKEKCAFCAEKRHSARCDREEDQFWLFISRILLERLGVLPPYNNQDIWKSHHQWKEMNPSTWIMSFNEQGIP